MLLRGKGAAMKFCVSKSYGNTRVFDHFQMEIPDGEIFCLLGKSGAGKTTLLNILAGLTPFGGEVETAEKKIGYIFQEPRLLPHMTVEKNLLYAGAKADEIDGVLQTLGLAAHKNKYPRALSGGEKQRVSIARAFLSGADLLLLDEPFSALDLALKVRAWEAFAAIWKEKKPTVLLVTHDLEEAWTLGHTVALLQDGEIVCKMKPNREELPSKYGVYDEQKQRLLNRLLERGDV